MNEERFKNLWHRCNISVGTAGPAAAYVVLAAHYGESWRRYHTAEHLDVCLRHFDSARQRMDEPDAVEMALWYHDAVYDIRGKDNEERSAQLFLQTVEGAADQGFCRRVYELIMVTQHMDPPEQGDARYVVDIDLSSFGQPWDAFMIDCRKVRAELTHLSDAEFDDLQAEFLRKLQNRPNFYASEFFRDRYEARARANIDRRLKLLDGEQGLN
jgi:predicted metal-dependent HD superfamily phosphohydrolase